MSPLQHLSFLRGGSRIFNGGGGGGGEQTNMCADDECISWQEVCERAVGVLGFEMLSHAILALF